MVISQRIDGEWYRVVDGNWFKVIGKLNEFEADREAYKERLKYAYPGLDQILDEQNKRNKERDNKKRLHTTINNKNFESALDEIRENLRKNELTNNR